MSRSKEFNVYEIWCIDSAREAGETYKLIAKDLGRSEAEVKLVSSRKEHRKRSGRTPKLTMRDRRHLLRKISNSNKSTRDIKNECDLDVSIRTINRIISGTPHIKRLKLKKAPQLRPIHQEARL